MIQKAASSPTCNDKRPCFAKLEYRGQQRCRILTDTYRPGKCPFCKPDASIVQEPYTKKKP